MRFDSRKMRSSLKSKIILSKPTMPKATASSPVVKPPSSYEDALEELEQLVARLESGDMPLEQLLSGYQRGAALLKFCRDKLEAIEGQVKVLDGDVLKPWTAS
jgi:exodeoxyribonuclease VII small subunit